MFDGRGSGGPKPSLWKKRAAEQFGSFFGRHSGSVPLPARPTDAAQSSATEVEPQPPPSTSTEQQQPPVEDHAPPPHQQQGESAAGTARPVVDGDVPHEGFRSRWQCDDDLPWPHEEPPQQRETVAVAWDAAEQPTLRMRLEPRSPVPHGGDEDLYEALVAEPLLDWTLEETDPQPPPPGAAQAPPLAPVGQGEAPSAGWRCDG